MKEAIISIILAGMVLGGVGFITSPRGAKSGWSDDHSDRMKGRESYYGEDTQRGSGTGENEPVQVRVLSEDAATAHYLQLEFDYEFRLGHGQDEDEVASLIEDRYGWLKDELLVSLSDEKASDLITGPGKYRLKRRLRKIVENTLFPEDEARVEDILFRSILVQPARN